MLWIKYIAFALASFCASLQNMAVYTKISESALDQLCNSYDIGKVVSCAGIAQGVTNSNFLLTTGRGRYILTIYENDGDRQALPFVLALQKYLSEKGIPCPQPVTDKNDNALAEIAGKPATIATFLKGASPENLQKQHCAALGDLLARMHVAGRDFKTVRPQPFGLSQWKNQYATCAKHPAGVPEKLVKIIEEELAFLDKRWPHGLPAGAIHGDLFPDNVLFEGATATGLIDFAYACTDSMAYDLMIAVNAWCLGSAGKIDHEKTAALFKSYQAVRPLEAAEMQNLSILGRGAALRFILLRLDLQQQHPGVALSNNKDPFEYAAKLAFHQNNDLSISF